MKQLALVFIGMLIFHGTIAQEIKKNQVKFANSFVDAVTNHNRKAIIKKIDKSYRESRIRSLEGNKVQFVNEFLGGLDREKYKFRTIILEDIEQIEITKVELTDNGYVYWFRIYDGKLEIFTLLHLVKKGKKYGFMGAIG